LSFAHRMTRTQELEHGTDEWSCTQCARRLLLRRPPEFDKVVLERGDETVTHFGGTAGIQITGVAAFPGLTGHLPAAEREWLATHGIDWEADKT
jgi:hypothetical protein